MAASEVSRVGTEGLVDEPQGLSAEVAALGVRISGSLRKDDGRDDVVSVWIGMRIAELMHEAEHAADAEARSAAATACQDLIFAAWDRRFAWPRGWPPHPATALAEVLELLSSTPGSRLGRRGALRSLPGWAAQLLVALDSLDRERRLWLLLCLREADLGELEGWLSAMGGVAGLRDVAALDDPGEGQLEVDLEVDLELDGGDVGDDEMAEQELLALQALARGRKDADAALERMLPMPSAARGRGSASTPEQLTAAAVAELRRLLRGRAELVKAAVARESGSAPEQIVTTD